VVAVRWIEGIIRQRSELAVWVVGQERVADEAFECPGASQIQPDAIGVTAVLKDQGKPS